MRVPDHSTIAEFRRRHERAIAELFNAVLELCHEAGLVEVGIIAIDGTKIRANASRGANRIYEKLVADILKEAEETDQWEDGLFGADRGDELYGDARGDELPEQLRTAEGRRGALRDAERKLEEQRTANRSAEQADDPVELDAVVVELDPEQIVDRVQGRRGWLREARDQLDEHRRQEARPVARSRAERLWESERRLREELALECAANEAYEAYRARGVMKDGRRFGGPPKPYVSPDEPDGKINITDPDSRNLKAFRGYVQGYNAQAVVTEQQIVIAAEVNSDSPDFGHLEPMITAARIELEQVGVTEQLDVALADSGYWHHQQLDQLAAEGIQVLIPPDAAERKGTRPGWDGGTLQLDASPARERARRRAISKTQRDDRAGIRSDQVQPQDRPVPAKRALRGALGMATSSRDPQPPQAPQPPDRHPKGLKRPRTRPFAATTGDYAPNPTGRSSSRPQAFVRQPPWKAAAPYRSAFCGLPVSRGVLAGPMRFLKRAKPPELAGVAVWKARHCRAAGPLH